LKIAAKLKNNSFKLYSTLQENVRVLVNSWRVRRSFYFLSLCCRTSISNLHKDRTTLTSMKSGVCRWCLLLTKSEWLLESH